MTDPEKKGVKPEELPPGVTLREHVYDGIQEYDQRLPNWWLWTLYISLIFAFVYWFAWYNGQAFLSDEDRLATAMDAIEARRFAMAGDVDNDSLWAMSRNANVIMSGEKVYRAQCAFCHGDDMSGGLGGGPALKGGLWKWGHEAEDIYSVVRDGSPDPTKGMQAWDRELGPARVAEVVAYILSYNNIDTMETAPDSPGRASLR